MKVVKLDIFDTSKPPLGLEKSNKEDKVPVIFDVIFLDLMMLFIGLDFFRREYIQIEWILFSLSSS